jgi:hypothetical protein
MNRKYRILFLSALLAALGVWFFWPKSQSSRLKVDVSNVANKLVIKHFDDAFFGADTTDFPEILRQIKLDYPPFFLSNDDSNFWLIQRKSKSQQNLYADRQRILPTYAKLDRQLLDAFAHYYHYYPQQDTIELYTYISNLDFDYPVIVADGLIFLAVDLYLGSAHPAYAQMAGYQSYQRHKQFITTDVLEALAFQYAEKNTEDNALINEMIWWGKVLYFIEAMQPAAADSITVKYTKEHSLFCRQNEAEMWRYFVDNQLVFNTGDDAKRKFIQPAPYSKFGMPFDNETPGGVGRWLGWQIVRSYMRSNPDVSLPALMQDKNSREIFRTSKYKP